MLKIRRHLYLGIFPALIFLDTLCRLTGYLDLQKARVSDDGVVLSPGCPGPPASSQGSQKPSPGKARHFSEANKVQGERRMSLGRSAVSGFSPRPVVESWVRKGGPPGARTRRCHLQEKRAEQPNQETGCWKMSFDRPVSPVLATATRTMPCRFEMHMLDLSLSLL